MQSAWLRARGAPGCAGLARWAKSTVNGDWTLETLHMGLLDEGSSPADRISGFATDSAASEAKEAQVVLGPLAEQVSGLRCMEKWVIVEFGSGRFEGSC